MIENIFWHTTSHFVLILENNLVNVYKNLVTISVRRAKSHLLFGHLLEGEIAWESPITAHLER